MSFTFQALQTIGAVASIHHGLPNSTCAELLRERSEFPLPERSKLLSIHQLAASPNGVRHRQHLVCYCKSFQSPVLHAVTLCRVGLARQFIQTARVNARLAFQVNGEGCNFLRAFGSTCGQRKNHGRGIQTVLQPDTWNDTLERLCPKVGDRVVGR